MKCHVSLVMIAIDDVTNQVITGNYIRPWIEWEKAAIWKQGFYVFVNTQQTECTLHMDSELYQPKELPITLENNKTKTIKVRFTPSPKYRIPSSFLVVRGNGIPGEKVFVYSDEVIQSFRLAKDYQVGELLGIYRAEGLELTGKKVWIKGNERSLFARLGEMSETEEQYYEVGELSMLNMEKFRKVETMIYLIYETVIQEDGTFFLLFPKGREEVCHAKLGYKQSQRDIVLHIEQENYMELEKE